MGYSSWSIVLGVTCYLSDDGRDCKLRYSVLIYVCIVLGIARGWSFCALFAWRIETIVNGSPICRMSEETYSDTFRENWDLGS